MIRETDNHLTLADAAKDFGGPGTAALAAYVQVLLCYFRWDLGWGAVAGLEA